MTVYGIPNCDTVKKALNWLNIHGLEYEFHNYKKHGITISKLQDWCKEKSWEAVLNKKGTTWKKLSPEEQQAINTQANAINFLVENTSAIKRPVIEKNGELLIGFDETNYELTLL